VTRPQRIAAFVLTLGVCSAAAVAASAGALAAGGVLKKCLHPRVTTVKVSEFEYGFTLSPKGAIPCGKVTFKQKNTGSSQHNFNIQGVKSGALIPAGGSTTFTIKLLRPGKYDYVCDVLGHAALGMTGTLTVK
jgi:plastocyanin